MLGITAPYQTARIESPFAVETYQSSTVHTRAACSTWFVDVSALLLGRINRDGWKARKADQPVRDRPLFVHKIVSSYYTVVASIEGCDDTL